MKDWSVAYKTALLSRAEIVKGILISSGIDAIVINKQDTTLHLTHGMVEVMVPSKKVLHAIKIVNDEIAFN